MHDRRGFLRPRPPTHTILIILSRTRAVPLSNLTPARPAVLHECAMWPVRHSSDQSSYRPLRTAGWPVDSFRRRFQHLQPLDVVIVSSRIFHSRCRKRVRSAIARRTLEVARYGLRLDKPNSWSQSVRTFRLFPDGAMVRRTRWMAEYGLLPSKEWVETARRGRSSERGADGGAVRWLGGRSGGRAGVREGGRTGGERTSPMRIRSKYVLDIRSCVDDE